MKIDIQVVSLKEKEKEKLGRLMQLYLHDLSQFFPITFNSKTCVYDYDLEKYFDGNYAYFIKSEDDILGFILIDDNNNDNYEISEIFVLNNYKGKKIAENSVFKIFDKFKGDWVIKAVPLSPVAEKFWNKVINDYTKGNYTVQHTGKYERAEFYFSNKD